jgi:peptidoglycan/LPS O-acetylase OafA/YrhL
LQNPESRFAEVDLLRFLAALAVMLLHYGIRGFGLNDHVSPLHFPVLGPLVRYNYLGVNLFFIISGFVILMSVQGRDLRGFAISRATRLYPAFWFCCTLTFLVILAFARDEIHTSLPRYVLNLTMLNELFGIGGIDGPYWTLLVEIKFYCMVAVLVALRQLGRMERYLGAWLAISAIYLVLPSRAVELLLIPGYSAYFIAGCLFFLMHKDGVSACRIVLLAASFVVAIAYDARILLDKWVWYGLPFSLATLVMVIGAFYLFFLFMVLRKRPRPSRRSAVYLLLGTLSYPLYLLHNNIGMAIFINLHGHVNRYVLLAGTCLFMLALARVVHVQVEKRYAPVLRRMLKAALYGRPRPQLGPVDAMTRGPHG